MRPLFPSVIDNSIRSSFVSCPRQCELQYIHHWQPRMLSVHLHAGGAYAHGLEAARIAFYQNGESAEKALALGLKALLEFYGDFECPPDSAKSAARMLQAMEYYASQYPFGSDAAKPAQITPTKMGIEFSFAEPIDVLHPESGDPIIYCGRMDEIVEFAGGLFGEDDKTTSSLGASWSRQWDLRSQFTGYCWGAAQAGIKLQGFLVRGIAILKTKFDTQQALTYRPQWMVDRWYKQLLRDVKRMISCWEEGYWDYNLDEACNAYGGCQFRRICLSQEPKAWLQSEFEQRRWNPITRQEELIKESE